MINVIIALLKFFPQNLGKANGIMAIVSKRKMKGIPASNEIDSVDGITQAPLRMPSSNYELNEGDRLKWEDPIPRLDIESRPRLESS